MGSDSTGDQFISLGKAAKIYGVSRTTILNWVKSGKLNAIKTVGNHYRVSLSELTTLRDKRSTNIGGPLRLMVVDDDDATVVLISEIVEDAFDQVSVLAYKDGYDALLAITSANPDVILLDLEMPNVDGFEFARSVRENADTKQIPIIVISAFLTEEKRTKLLGFGITQFLEKINFQEHIADSIQEALPSA